MANGIEISMDGAAKFMRAHESRLVFENLIALEKDKETRQACAFALLDIQQHGGDIFYSDFERLYPDVETLELRMHEWIFDAFRGFRRQKQKHVDAT